MIKKTIHYCWFGRNPKSTLIEKCIVSWKKYLPEYQIIEWNEDNFDINENQYVKEAYEAKKWAFVSDYVRLWALREHGGIYLDTDVEVFRNFDAFLEHRFFTGFEKYGNAISPITAIMGAEAKHPLLDHLLDEYQESRFINPDGSHNTTTNTSTITKLLIKTYGVDAKNDSYQQLADDIHIYPSHYFCIEEEGKTTYSIHHFAASWRPYKKQLKARIRRSKRIPKKLGILLGKLL